MRVIEDDKTNYTPALNQFPQELNVGNLSASTLWELYRTDLKVLLLEHAETKSSSTPEYMNLYFKIKGFYFKVDFGHKQILKSLQYVADLPQYKNSIPEFPE